MTLPIFLVLLATFLAGVWFHMVFGTTIYIACLRGAFYVKLYRARCPHCDRRLTVCSGKNECEESEKSRRHWQAQSRKMMIPMVGFLGKLMTAAAEQGATEETLTTPNLNGDLRPPNG